MRVFAVLAILVVLTGCAKTTESRQDVVSQEAIAEFLQVLERGDYHDVARKGKTLLEKGRVIRDHAKVFGAYPSAVVENGMVRYDLLSFTGDASVGHIYLLLDKRTGRIVEFGFLEATLVPDDDSTGRRRGRDKTHQA